MAVTDIEGGTGMGLVEKYRARTVAKIDNARAKAESKAQGEGADPAAVSDAGDKAARRKRRRLRFTGYGGAGGTS